MSTIQERKLKNTGTTTRDATPTPIVVLPSLPLNGSFALRGTVIARNTDSGAVVTFFPINSGTIVAGAITQSGGTAQASPCKTSPADGGTAQDFAPPGCSSLTNGAGLTVGLALNGRVVELMVTGIAGASILWSAALDLTIQSS